MVNKKAQAQIITTILIILLVLAAIIIIWQVVQGTVQQGAEEIERQASCLGLRIDITNTVIATSDAKVTFRPTKDISGYQVYVEGESKGPENSQDEIILALKTKEVTVGSGIALGDEIEVIATMGDAKTACPGQKHTVKN